MSEDKATKIFSDYVKKIYGDIDILAVNEKKKYFLFEFCKKGDECPIDYPIIAVQKDNGKIRELVFTNAADRKIIYED